MASFSFGWLYPWITLLFEEEHTMEKIRRIEEITRREMVGFTDPRIREIRIMGGCVCIEVYDLSLIHI